MNIEAKNHSSEGEKKRAAPAKLRHSWCHAQAALCCSWRCLHPFFSLELQLLFLVKAFCAACSACSPKQQTWLSRHTSEPSGETLPDADFFPIHDLNTIHSNDAGQPVTWGEPETNESAGHYFCMLCTEKCIALYSAIRYLPL